MFIEDFKNIKSTHKEIRQFSLIVGVFMILFGSLSLQRGQAYAQYIFLAAILILLLSIFFPKQLKPAQRAWMTIALILGWIMTRAILTVLFFIVLTPLSLFLRLMGKKFLDISFPDQSRNSYWINKDKDKFNKESCERQF